MLKKCCLAWFRACFVCRSPPTYSFDACHSLSCPLSHFTLSSSHHSALVSDSSTLRPFSFLYYHSFLSDAYWTHWSSCYAHFISFPLPHSNFPAVSFIHVLIFMFRSNVCAFLLSPGCLGDNAASEGMNSGSFEAIMISHFFRVKTRLILPALASLNVRWLMSWSTAQSFPWTNSCQKSSSGLSTTSSLHFQTQLLFQPVFSRHLYCPNSHCSLPQLNCVH